MTPEIGNGGNIPISVVIPTYNRLHRLKQVLHAFERQTIPSSQFELVVVSDGATDGTNAFLSDLETPMQIRALILDNGGPAAARNEGVAAARGKLILFVDDDVVPAPDLVEMHLRQHVRRGPNCVVLGPMLTPDDHWLSPWVNWEQVQLYKQYDAMTRGEYAPTARQFYTGNSSLSRAAILDVGGFDETLWRAEDIELGFRLASAGLKFNFCMDARGYHYAERTYRSWIDIAHAYGRCVVLFSQSEFRPGYLDVTLREFSRRNMAVRRATRLCIDRPRTTTALFNVLRSCITLSRRIGLTKVELAACSGMYNVRFYQGVADELGGRRPFLAALAASQPERQAPEAVMRSETETRP